MATSKPVDIRIWAEGGQKTDPGNSKYAQGWVVEIPTLQNMNFIQNQITQMMKHINEQGIVQWDNLTNYPIGAIAKGSNNIAYKALNANVADDPVTSANWEIFGASSGDFTQRVRVDANYEVGPTGDFASITEAIEKLSIGHPEYLIGGIHARLQLQPGFVIAEEIHVDGVDLSWIIIDSGQGDTPYVVQSSAIVTDFAAGQSCAFGARNNGTLPSMDFFAKFDVPNSGITKNGMLITTGGRVAGWRIGFEDAGNAGISVHLNGAVHAHQDIRVSGAQIHGLHVTTGGSVSGLTNLYADNCKKFGIEAVQGGHIHIIESITAQNAVDSGAKAWEGGFITTKNIIVNGSSSIGANAAVGGEIVAVEAIEASNCVWGISAFSGSVHADSIVANDCLNTGLLCNGANGGIFANLDMTALRCGVKGIDILRLGSMSAGGDIDVSFSGSVGIEVDSGGTIAANNITADNANLDGVTCNGSGSAVNAISNLFTRSCTQYGVVCNNSSGTSAETMTATSCGQGGIVSFGGHISAVSMFSRRGASDGSNDTVVGIGGMVVRQSSVGGTSQSTGVFNSSGYINI